MNIASRSVVIVAAFTAVAMVAPAAGSAVRDLIPSEFAVCVTTVDAPGQGRLDSYWPTEADARARRAEILATGWTTEGDEVDREDEYPPHSIVKATVDPTLINRPSCLPPAARRR